MKDVNGNNIKEYKALYIPLDEKIDEPLKTIIDISFENWEKIK